MRERLRSARRFDDGNNADALGMDTQDSGSSKQYIWSVIDQGLYSVTNLVGLALLAQLLSKVGFGAASLAAVTAAILIGLLRSLISEPLLVRRPDRLEACSVMAGGGLAAGLTFGVVLLLAALIANGPVRLAFLALAVSLIGVLVQDCLRYTHLIFGSPKNAVPIDLVWLGTTALLFLGNFLWWPPSVFGSLMCWLGGASVAAIFELVRQRVVPDIKTGARLIRQNFDLGKIYLGEYLSLQGLMQIAMYGMTILIGLEALGTLRATQLVYGPLGVLFTGIYPIALPATVRICKSGKSPVRIAIVLSTLSVLIGLLWTGAMLLTPGFIFEFVLGDKWDGAETVLGLVGLGIATSGVVVGPTIGLRALGRQRDLALIRTSITLVSSVAAVGASSILGLEGFIIVGIISWIVIGGASWLKLHQAADVAVESHEHTH